jgi:cobyrinic acid a,c-diamide synthase
MKLKRVMIAAPKSGSGKTTITCAILQALKISGNKVVSYKCGPDYIDPMFHKKAIGISSKNLDTFFTGEEKTRELFLEGRTEEEIAVLEGVMGLFDGLGGIREEGSSYHLAKVTKTPIILVVDAKGMGRSLLPVIAGFLSYDKEGLIKGVILNRMSPSYYEAVKPLLEEELSLKVLGYFPEQKELRLESRHLGLVTPDEMTDIQGQLQRAANQLSKTVSLEEIMEIAQGAEMLETPKSEKTKSDKIRNVGKKRPVIAVARDEAFCFYYEDNLRILEENGAVLTYFSPLYDTSLPKGCSGLLLGGGYPELYAKRLSENEGMRAAVREAFQSGLPVVAECGGFMYLHSAIVDKEGASYPMVGAISAACVNRGKLVRFGYIELSEKESRFLPKGEMIRGHEFHYFDSEKNGEDCVARKPVTGREYDCVMVGESYWIGFPHLYYPSNLEFPKRFVEKAAGRLLLL